MRLRMGEGSAAGVLWGGRLRDGRLGKAEGALRPDDPRVDGDAHRIRERMQDGLDGDVFDRWVNEGPHGFILTAASHSSNSSNLPNSGSIYPLRSITTI